MGLDEISYAVQHYTSMLKDSLEVLMQLQEDPNIQGLEREVRKLQQQYDSIKGTLQMVALTQRLAQMQ